VFFSIGIVFFKALTSPIKCFRVVASKEDSTLLVITNSVFYFMDLCREDISVVCDSKC